MVSGLFIHLPMQSGVEEVPMVSYNEGAEV